MDFTAQVALIQDDFAKSRCLLTALGDETRQLILTVLMNADKKDVGMRVGEITEKTHLSRPAVSHQMKILLDVGLTRVRHVGTMNFYSLNFGPTFQNLLDLVLRIEELRVALIDSGKWNPDTDYRGQ
jgi:ArsR family transcriptional regulator